MVPLTVNLRSLSISADTDFTDTVARKVSLSEVSQHLSVLKATADLMTSTGDVASLPGLYTVYMISSPEMLSVFL